MKRLFLLPLLQLSLLTAQEKADLPEATQDRMAEVSASDSFRSSLRKATEVTPYEALPDPAHHPKLFKKEIEDLRTKMAMTPVRVADQLVYPFSEPYRVEREYDTWIEALTDPAGIHQLESEKKLPHFHAENLISWESGKSEFQALISFRLKQIVFARDGERLRYRLEPKTYQALVDHFRHTRRFRPDAREEARRFLDALESSSKVSAYEGTPRPNLGDPTNSKKTRGTFVLDGYEFYKTGTPERDTKKLKSILAAKDSIIEWRGIKACGGFHPDLCLIWGPEDNRSRILICLTCHEVMIEDTDSSLLFDIGNEAYEELKAEVEQFRAVAN